MKKGRKTAISTVLSIIMIIGAMGTGLSITVSIAYGADQYQINVNIAAPVCGVTTATPGLNPSGTYDVTTQTNRPEGAVSTSGWRFYQAAEGIDMLVWERGNTEWSEAPIAFQGTFNGGDEYYVGGTIERDGADMPDSVSISVNGVELDSGRVYALENSQYVKFVAIVKAVHDLEHYGYQAAGCEEAGYEDTKVIHKIKSC